MVQGQQRMLPVWTGLWEGCEAFLCSHVSVFGLCLHLVWVGCCSCCTHLMFKHIGVFSLICVCTPFNAQAHVLPHCLQYVPSSLWLTVAYLCCRPAWFGSCAYLVWFGGVMDQSEGMRVLTGGVLSTWLCTGAMDFLGGQEGVSMMGESPVVVILCSVIAVHWLVLRWWLRFTFGLAINSGTGYWLESL